MAGLVFSWGKMRMKVNKSDRKKSLLKIHDYYIVVKYKEKGVWIGSSFFMKSVPVKNVDVAYKIARILYPNVKNLYIEAFGCSLNEETYL